MAGGCLFYFLHLPMDKLPSNSTILFVWLMIQWLLELRSVGLYPQYFYHLIWMLNKHPRLVMVLLLPLDFHGYLQHASRLVVPVLYHLDLYFLHVTKWPQAKAVLTPGIYFP